ncbi:hypothetical protein ACCI51_18685 [Microbulbifer echini]|uniref:Aspartyl protease n=1 Tax=Microbulbifer echini TaxID=1529067 RepID=A0ABV4NT63_9GAMM
MQKIGSAKIGRSSNLITVEFKMTSCKFSSLCFSGVIFSAGAFSHENNCKSIEVPIVFDQYGLPTIELIINGQKNFALLDLGSTAGIHLPASDINSMSGVKYTGKTSKSTNISGKVFDDKEYVVSMLTIQCMTFENITGYELNPWAASIGDKPEDVEDNQQIVIGQGFFADKKIIINYADKKLIVSKKMGSISSKNNSKFKPYVLNDEGITIQMSSSIANYQMVLDTGATNSILSINRVNIKESLAGCDFNLGPDVKCELFTSKVDVAGYDFVPNILLYPIDSRFTKDGLLGSDFFDKFIVELDLANKKFSLTPSKGDVL